MSSKIKRLTSLMLTAFILVSAVFFHTYAAKDNDDIMSSNEIVDGANITLHKVEQGEKR